MSDILSYKRDFNVLWSYALGERPTASADLFVRWDGVPEGDLDIGIREFLTIFDWAAALALKSAHQAKQTTIALHQDDFRVHVLMATAETLPRSFSALYGPALASAYNTASPPVSNVGGLLPWLVLYAPHQFEAFNAASRGNQALGAGIPTLRDFTNSVAGERACELIQRLWASELTAVGRRHSVSNAIGPVALAHSMALDGFRSASRYLTQWKDRGDQLQGTFYWFLETLGLLPLLPDRKPDAPEQSILGGLGRRKKVAYDNFGRFRRIRFALVDDQANAGFHDVLSGFLLGDGYNVENFETTVGPVTRASLPNDGHSLSSYDHPQVLLDWLEHAAPALESGHPTLFGKLSPYRHPAAHSSGSDFDILFLDLRLHGISGSEESGYRLEEWRAKVRALLERFGNHFDQVAKNLSENQRLALNTSLSASRDPLPGPGDKSQALAELALLPVLISVCDPTVPVIIFSSSQQRRIYDLLAPFPNIVMEFSKPSLTGYSNQDRDDLAAGAHQLQRALIRALDMHEKRLLWELIFDFNLEDAAKRPCKLQVRRPRGRAWPAAITEHPQYAVEPPEKDELRLSFNSEGMPDLKFTDTPWYRKRLTSIARRYTVEPPTTDRLHLPFEFVEACLGDPFKRLGECSPQLQFDSPDWSSSVAGWEIAMHDIKTCRHKVVHGSLSRAELASNSVSFVETIVALCLYQAISDERLDQQLSALSARTSLLARAILENDEAILNSLPTDKRARAQIGATDPGITKLLTAIWHNKPVVKRLRKLQRENA